MDDQYSQEPLAQEQPGQPSQGTGREYASVWTRFGAILIDGLLVFLFYIPLLAVDAMAQTESDISALGAVIILLSFISAIVFLIWNTIIRMGKTGQSLGRKFLNIAVLTEDGRPIGIGNTFLREIIGRWISGLVCYIGYLNAFWDPRRQMWHDKMANCYVYYVEENFS